MEIKEYANHNLSTSNSATGDTPLQAELCGWGFKWTEAHLRGWTKYLRLDMFYFHPYSLAPFYSQYAFNIGVIFWKRNI